MTETPRTDLDALAARRPSIGDDGAVVLAADMYGALPPGTDRFHLMSLIAHGYVRHVDTEEREAGPQSTYVLTESGRALARHWADIRGHTVTESRPYGLLTPPSPGEIRDNEHPDGQGHSLLRGRH